MTEEKKQLTENQDSFIMHPTVDFCFKELMENAKVTGIDCGNSKERSRRNSENKVDANNFKERISGR